ncbi:MAG: YdeI/OmpD-associated family protein [Acidimicrobiia bacterium]|jgi:uncharacterized protein YdeI (YjbR/CyaY-like superfamily)
MKTIPNELTAALAANPEAQRIFLGMSPSHQRQYAMHVAEAKRPETRRRRAAQMIRLILTKGDT